MMVLANAGVPMLFVVAPVLVLAIVPVVVVEAALYRWFLRVPFRKAFSGSMGANLLSTLLGVPATWFALVLLQMVTGGGGWRGSGIQAVTWQAAWLIPHEENLRWMIPAAAMVLHVPFFLASVFTERLVLLRVWKEVDRRALTRACWLANGCSYAGLLVFWGLEFVRRTSA
jgi:hypothetical protein